MTRGLSLPRAALIPLVFAIAMAGAAAPARAAELTDVAVSAWDSYVAATEARRARELTHGRRFLALEFGNDAARSRRALLGGAIVIDEVPGVPAGAGIVIPGGTIHHWRAAVFVPGITLDGLLAALRDPDEHGYAPPGVLKRHLLYRQHDRERVFLRIRRQEIVTAVFNTEHAVEFRRHTAARAESRSVATRIAELAGGGEGASERPVGRDRGFLWRLNTYWRYEAVPGGVLVELESLTLSRGTPGVLRPVAQPIVTRIARESIVTTLAGIRDQLGKGTGPDS
jgi:hypothetical protein